MKKCSKCKKIKSIDKFYKSSKSKDGYRYWCKFCMNNDAEKYRQNHEQKCKQYYKKYAKTHRKQLKNNRINWIKNNKEIYKKQQKKYQQSHKQQRNKYRRKRRKNDLNFKLKCYLRKRIWETLKGRNKSKSTIVLIGCSILYLNQHLQKQFKPGMAWNNYGTGWYGKGKKQWHIDHIIPCAKFDLSKSEEQKKCFHYTNLQPLWAKENWSKNDKIIKEKK